MQFETHRKFHLETFRVPSQMAQNIQRLKSLSQPFELDFFQQLKEHFSKNEYSIQEKLALVGRSLLLNGKLSVLRNWFNVMDLQLLKDFVRKFEQIITPKTIAHFAQLSVKSAQSRLKLTVYEETIQSLLTLQQSLCTRLNLAKVRQIVESPLFFKINHLLYSNHSLLSLKVATLVRLKMTSQAEILVHYCLAMRRVSLGLLRKSVDRNKFQALFDVNRVNFEQNFADFSDKFKLKLASSFQREFRESSNPTNPRQRTPTRLPQTRLRRTLRRLLLPQINPNQQLHRWSN